MFWQNTETDAQPKTVKTKTLSKIDTLRDGPVEWME